VSSWLFDIIYQIALDNNNIFEYFPSDLLVEIKHLFLKTPFHTQGSSVLSSCCFSASQPNEGLGSINLKHGNPLSSHVKKCQNKAEKGEYKPLVYIRPNRNNIGPNVTKTSYRKTSISQPWRSILQPFPHSGVLLESGTPFFD